MQVQSPEYQFYKMLAGTWKSADGACTAEITTGRNIVICYDGARLSREFSFIQKGQIGIGYVPGNMVGYMGMFMAAGMLNDVHEGEELKIKIDSLALSREGEELWRVDEAWYGRLKIHLELTGVRNGQKRSLTLTREDAFGAAQNKVSWALQGTSAESDALTFTCECGYHGSARKFCPECGKTVPIHTCECGCVSIGAKFCPECGKAIQIHTCECGYVSVGVKFCPNCGMPTVNPTENLTEKLNERSTEKSTGNPTETPTEKKVYKKKELLFVITMSMSTNPPRTDGAKVYAYSDTELVLEHGGEQRLISTDVIEPAYEIIRKNRLDDPDFKDPVGAAMMGGTANIGFKNGDQWVNASMYDKGNAALSAYYGLMGLFDNA